MAYVNSNRAASASYRDRVVAVFANIRAASARRRLYGQTLRELSGLSDRELMDLGIERSSIATIAAEAAYGK